MNQLTIAGFDRCDFTNNPGDDNFAFTIWFSGCTHKCRDCHNVELWNKNSGDIYDVDAVLNIIKSTNAKYVVLLGGEPLQQNPLSLFKLCDGLYNLGIKIWLYTGYDLDEVSQKHGNILQYLYTMKCGRYDYKLSKVNAFPASLNQMLYRNFDGVWRQINIEREV